MSMKLIASSSTPSSLNSISKLGNTINDHKYEYYKIIIHK
jgi:hypothetical protein